MYVRSLKRCWKIQGTFLQRGDCMPITHEQIQKYMHLIEGGDLEVLDKHPDEKARAAKRKRRTTPTKTKQRALKSEGGENSNG